MRLGSVYVSSYLLNLLHSIVSFSGNSKFLRLDIYNDQHWIWNIAAAAKVKPSVLKFQKKQKQHEDVRKTA